MSIPAQSNLAAHALRRPLVTRFLGDLIRCEAETRDRRRRSTRGNRAAVQVFDYAVWAETQRRAGTTVVSWDDVRPFIGHWYRALDAAALRAAPGPRDLPERQDVMDALAGCWAELVSENREKGGPPPRPRLSERSYDAYRKRHSKAPSRTVVKRWFKTWADACAAVGAAPGASRAGDAAMLAAVSEVARGLGHAPSTREYDRRRRGDAPTAYHLTRRLGCSWPEVVRAAGWEPRRRTPRSRRR